MDKRRAVKKNEPPASGDKRKRGSHYNLRSKGPVKEEDDTMWVDEDTGSESEDTADTKVNGITVPSNIPVSVKIHLHTFVDEDEDEDLDEDEEEDSDYDEEEDSEEEEEDSDEDSEEEEDSEAFDEFLDYLASKYSGPSYGKRQMEPQPFIIITNDGTPKNKEKKAKKGEIVPAIKLDRHENKFFDGLSKAKKKLFNTKMEGVANLLADPEMPFKFKILELPVSDHVKAGVIKKVDTINKMGPDSGEAHKLKTWVDAFLRIPFGKQITLPVKMDDGGDKCSKFLMDARGTLDKAVYGMVPAKTQIMQVLAQWIANPGSVGNVIALKGPAGIGKTSLARNGIAGALKRPFQFFSLGGASDVAHYVGHSYTYEGSMWGRIVDSIMQAGCMNPVLYFDELDKVSGTHQGDEIISMLIHLTDRSQNMHYHDRYFAGIDFDLSQCLFVFSFNDESKVHPVLKDRMNVIQCTGYNDDEKKIILGKYVAPELMERFKFKTEDIQIDEEAVKYIIKEYSAGEEGMRSLIRVVETLVMRINLLRISDKNDEATKSLKFFMDVTFPLKITKEVVEKLMSEYAPSQKKEVPFGMYV